MYFLSFDKIELKETEGEEWKSLQLLTISCISVSMSLKKPLAYIPNFCFQEKTSRLPTSYPAHLFATRSGIFLLLPGFFNNARQERVVKEVFLR